jgi:hypothetical protein
MLEHGFLKHSPVLEGADGEVIDGRARVAAAARANLPFVRHSLVARRDTPLQRALLVIDLNRARLSPEVVERAYAEIERRLGRPWSEVEADLEVTREWRRSVPRRTYKPTFDVRKVRYREGDEPKVQITRDGTRVMLRSLVEAAGLSNYKIKYLRDYVVQEEAQTKFSANRIAIFVRIDEAIEGIRRMQQDRRGRGLTLDKEWGDIRRWLISQSRSGSVDNDGVVESHEIEDAAGQLT